MKHIINKVAKSLGYQISRVSCDTINPFSEMKRLCSHIERPVIFDIGAHHGQTAQLFRELFPKAEICSFEPFQESFNRLQLVTNNDPNIKVFNFGLSDRNGMLKFQSNPSSATNSLLPTDSNGPETWGKGLLETKRIVEAEFKTLDTVLIEEQIPKVDILKLDVQGAEHLVLKGADSAFAGGSVDLIYSEIITQPTYEGQKRLDEAIGAFYDCGFDLHNIFNLSLTKDGILRQMDVIFTRRKQTNQLGRGEIHLNPERD